MKLKMLIGCKRLPRGRQALPGGAAGWGRIIGFTRYAAVFVMSRTKTATTIRKPASGPNLPGPVPRLAKTVAGNLIPPMALHSEIRLCRPHPR